MNFFTNRFNLIIFSLILVFSASCNKPAKISFSEKPKDDFPAFSRLNDEKPSGDFIDLDGKWQFRSTDEREWMDAEVPGTVQQDLIRAGKLRDPYYRDNEFDAQWVEKKEWEYRREFTVDRTFLQKDKIILDCRGLDDICALYLNDSLIANTQNMFIEYEFDVKKHLKEGKNTLRAVFSPVLEWNKKQAEADPRVTWHKGKDATGDGTKGLLFFSRKEASDFGWDWGIRLVSCGIWRPVRLAGYNKARITGLRIDQDLADPKTAVLDISAETERYSGSGLYLKIDVSLRNKTVGGVTLPVRENIASGPVVIPNPELWWPNGWGEHPLYTVKAELYDNTGTIDTRQFRIGLRSIQISEENDSRGLSFGIKVNGRLIFCKGANWIPADALPGRLTEAKYTDLLSACKEANMNMIRLWGGGLYEPEIFYDYCDENGIMIWHDFMFASGPYLATESYLKNVEAEIKNVVVRLRHHPSIALWCGNNESEINMVGGQDWLKKYPGVTWEDFDKIFYDLIPRTAALYDPGRPYYPSSPHNPLDRTKSTPDWQTSSGTVHTYEVWGGEKRFDAFSQMGKYRFVAEFGFQSLPHIETVNYFTAPEDRYFPSAIMDHHNLTGKKPNQNQGNVRIATFTADMFRLPAGIRNWVTVSQILQGEGMKMGCEALRRNYPNSTGAMYWQLNDNWPVISWSSIDYFGRWKALQYMAKHFFSPVLLSGVIKEDSVIIYSSNDCLEEKKCRLEWNLSQFDGTVLRKGSKDVLLPENTSAVTDRIGLGDLAREDSTLGTYRKDSYRKREKLFFSFRLLEGDSVLSSNTLFFVPPKYLELRDPGLKFKKSVENGRIRIDLTAEYFAPYVELGINGSYARFSDNYFHLAPGEKKTVYINSSELPGEETLKRFFARSLFDTYSRE
ncbi:MAG TPA: glycoside hydrolase family 2 protein [Lentimicrobium sp.]|nr:glycoside hydrolase family 2 protein [Lentimicrobium sp.]